MIKRVLIANRGEIAVRIARTCREMGMTTIGVYSDADRDALHVHTVDEAYHIGAAPSSESYLNQSRLLSVAEQAKADAIHPGYGFLSENSGFARRVTDAGLIWIGPPASAIEAMGSKTGARALMKQAGVPVVPGSEGALADYLSAEKFADTVGYPVLLKAVAGGGGKGMRVVSSRAEIRAAFEAAQREAISAFGDGSIYLEKYIEQPRHIEIQVAADQYGNVIHLGERECSIQRRHQKIIEESPSVAVSSELRESMGKMAVAAAAACGYVNAGTIETVMGRDGQFYFLEMNTRLQVEHPVTEEVAGLDLVRLQLEIADGSPIPWKQEEIQSRGHAIEVRVYAEDVKSGFLPSPGRLLRLRPPAGPGVRVDSGYREGDEVPRFYDPMIAKLIVRAESRGAAISRALRALEEYEVAGVRTDIPFCHHILSSEKFLRGEFHTRSADGEFLDSFIRSLEDELADAAIVAAALAHNATMTSTNAVSGTSNPKVVSESRWLDVGRKAAVTRS